MGPLGHCAVGLAANRWAPTVPLGLLLLATLLLDILWFPANYAGLDATAWTHGLFMSVVWSILAALLIARVYSDHPRRIAVAVVVGLTVFSHWLLDFVSHPIPFPSFSWHLWQWSYGRPLPPDLPLFFGASPKLGLGLYNSISALEATTLELGMFLLGATAYATYKLNQRKIENG